MQIRFYSHAGEQEVACERSEQEQLKPGDEIHQVVCCLVDEVENMHRSAYADTYWPLLGAAKNYNAIAWAVRSLPPYQQFLALDSAEYEWGKYAKAMLALERANGKDVKGPGFCQLRSQSVSECTCSVLCAVCGLPQWHHHCRLWQRGKCECRIVGVTPNGRWLKSYSDAEVAEVWPNCMFSMALRQFRAESSASVRCVA